MNAGGIVDTCEAAGVAVGDDPFAICRACNAAIAEGVFAARFPLNLAPAVGWYRRPSTKCTGMRIFLNPRPFLEQLGVFVLLLRIICFASQKSNPSEEKYSLDVGVK